MIDASVAGDLDKIIELKDRGIDINVFTPVSLVYARMKIKRML